MYIRRSLKWLPYFCLVYNRFPIREAHKNLYLPFHGTLQKWRFFSARAFALCVCLPIYISSAFSYVSISHPVAGVEDKWQRKNRRQNDSPFAHAESNTNNKTWAKKSSRRRIREKKYGLKLFAPMYTMEYHWRQWRRHLCCLSFVRQRH